MENFCNTLCCEITFVHPESQYTNSRQSALILVYCARTVRRKLAKTRRANKAS